MTRQILSILVMGWFWLSIAQPGFAATALVLSIHGAIGPATVDYVHRGLERAEEQGASVVVLQMDTPGGLDSAMREIIQDILTARVPVISFVAPSGAIAASAGTYILYASHIAAMAPGTNLGAATPVQLGGLPTPSPAKPDSPAGNEEEPQSDSGGSAMERKLINDATAYLRSLAQLRGRNEEWAARAVREGASLPAEEALSQGVIDLIAGHIPELLKQTDGREVQLLNQKHVLQTSGLAIERSDPDWRSELLAIITNPNVAYILMLIGIYGLVFEFANPGTLAPGITGVIALVLALYAFQVLPINYAGLGLIVLGIALMIAEAFAPSFGALGIGGGIAFVFGSIILMDTDAPGFGLSPWLVGVLALMNLAFFAVVLGALFKSRKRPVVSGREMLLGSKGVALSDFDSAGQVRVQGEIWQARTNQSLTQGQDVRITDLDGLELQVEPLEKELL